MSEDLWGNKPGNKDEQPATTEELSQGPDSGGDEANRKAHAKESREWRLINKLVMGLHAEQRRSRRWGIFFKSLTFLYLFALLYLLIPDKLVDTEAVRSGPHTALVEIKGVIAEDQEANADDIIAALRDAFKDKGTKGIMLRINSPGGSPVQAGYVYDEIKRLRGLYPNTKVYAVVSDLCASGGYYIASAADEIYADKASLVGSIGVISSGFGFVDLMKKLGVERRSLTAGEHKAFLDPFSPLKPDEKKFWQSVLDTTHQQFIEQVKKGRGDRLKDNDQLFTGLIWTGEQALKLGLIDGLGSPSYVAREVIGANHIVDFSPHMSPVEKLVERFSTRFAKTMATELGLSAPILH